MSTAILEGSQLISIVKFPTAKFLPTWRSKSQVLPGILAHLSAWMGIHSVKFQSNLKRAAPLIYPIQFPRAKFLSTSFSSNVLPVPLAHLSAWWDYAPETQSRVSNVNFDMD
jgi:hypothetical protein